jgi:hypothetical protein
MHGKGSYILKYNIFNKLMYQNKPYKKGVYYQNYGEKYEGDFQNNKRNGKGIFYYKSGDRYIIQIK